MNLTLDLAKVALLAACGWAVGRRRGGVPLVLAGAALIYALSVAAPCAYAPPEVSHPAPAVSR